MRRTEPLSRKWGYDRGQPVDRYYIEQFVVEHRSDICGRVLEVKENLYTDRYGTAVTHRAVLDIDPSNPDATIVADLAAADAIPSESFDCFVLTQTLQLISEPRAAVAHAHRVLRPGGVLLATVPTASRVVHPDDDVDYWRFTPAGCRYLFGSVFAPDAIDVRAFGNVLTLIAFLMGMAADELKLAELEAADDEFPLVVAVRAVKR